MIRLTVEVLSVCLILAGLWLTHPPLLLVAVGVVGLVAADRSSP